MSETPFFKITTDNLSRFEEFNFRDLWGNHGAGYARGPGATRTHPIGSSLDGGQRIHPGDGTQPPGNPIRIHHARAG